MRDVADEEKFRLRAADKAIEGTIAGRGQSCGQEPGDCRRLAARRKQPAGLPTRDGRLAATQEIGDVSLLHAPRRSPGAQGCTKSLRLGWSIAIGMSLLSAVCIVLLGLQRIIYAFGEGQL